MLSSNGHTPNELLPTVIDAVKTVRPDAAAVGAATRLVGAGALLDSVGLVSLLVNLEQRFDNAVDLASSLIDSAGVPEEELPYRTVSALADHIHQLLASRGR